MISNISPPVPVENLRSEILVVQSAQNWHRQRATDSLDGTRDRRVLVQRGRRTRRNAMAIARHSSHSELSPRTLLRRHRRLRGCTALQELRHMPRLAGFAGRARGRIATDLGLQLDDVDELVGLAV